MELWTIISALIFGAVCIYLYSTRNYNYFEKLGIPYVRPVPFFGNMWQVILKIKSPSEVVQEAYDLDPDAKYVGFFDLSTPVILLKDPELVKSIAIKNFDSFPNHRMFVTSPTEPLYQKNLFALQDDTWREMRAVLSPAFTSSKMKMMFKIMSDCVVTFADYLSKLDPRPEELDMKETFGRCTMDIIASTAFGLNVNSMKETDNDFYKFGKETADFSGLKMVKFFLTRSCPRLASLLNVKFLPPKVSDFFINAIENTIATRDAEGIVRPDMIHLMMQARDRRDKSALTTEDIAAQAFIFVLGGFDGPATTMSFASLALALNPDVQRKLQAEIDDVLRTNSGEVSYEALHSMKYLDAVVNETLRMFPPNAIMDRIGPKSFTLPPALPGLEPLTVNPGQNIFIAVHSFHRDARYFPDPKKFDPERFNDDNKSKINPLTYLPFGIGPRICIANRFALMEVKLALFHVLAKCNFLKTSKTRSPIKLTTNPFPITPEGGFWLKVEPRNVNDTPVSVD